MWINLFYNGHDFLGLLKILWEMVKKNKCFANQLAIKHLAISGTAKITVAIQFIQFTTVPQLIFWHVQRHLKMCNQIQ